MDGELEAGVTYDGSSSKVDQLVQLLQMIPATEKSLVFSQFTSFLDKASSHLKLLRPT